MTAQRPDWLIYEGEKRPLFSNPLESFFDDDHPRPDFRVFTSGNWRGYVAKWKIEDDSLYLAGLSGHTLELSPMTVRMSDGTLVESFLDDVRVEDLFPGAKGGVKATWFTGTLRAPQGKRLEYVHQGYASIYEEELLLTIEAGKLVRTEIRDGRDQLREMRKRRKERLSYLKKERVFEKLEKLWPYIQADVEGREELTDDKFLSLINELEQADDENQEKRRKVLSKIGKILTIILLPIIIVILPFIVPYLIYKHGWNPRKWNLF